MTEDELTIHKAKIRDGQEENNNDLLHSHKSTLSSHLVVEAAE